MGDNVVTYHRPKGFPALCKKHKVLAAGNIIDLSLAIEKLCLLQHKIGHFGWRYDYIQIFISGGGWEALKEPFIAMG